MSRLPTATPCELENAAIRDIAVDYINDIRAVVKRYDERLRTVTMERDESLMREEGLEWELSEARRNVELLVGNHKCNVCGMPLPQGDGSHQGFHKFCRPDWYIDATKANEERDALRNENEALQHEVERMAMMVEHVTTIVDNHRDGEAS